MNKSVSIDLLIPNIGLNVKSKLTNEGIEITYLLACDSQFRSNNYSVIKSKKGRFFVVNTWNIPYKVGFQ